MSAQAGLRAKSDVFAFYRYSMLNLISAWPVEFQLQANYKIDYFPSAATAVSLSYQRCKQIIRNIEKIQYPEKIQHPYERGPYPMKPLLSSWI